MEIPALVHPIIQGFLHEYNLKLWNWCDTFGTPYHLLFPEIFMENINSYKDIFKKNSVNWKIFFAFKANKSKAFLATALISWIWVEVSSIFELRLALSEWFTWENIMVSWPTKTPEYIKLAIRHKAIIAVDEYGEFNDIKKLANPNDKVQIFLRINIHGSRFWLTKVQRDNIYANLSDIISIVWLSFHINDYLIESRIEVIKYILDEISMLSDKHIRISAINIGWWFTIQYFSSEQWDDLKSKINPNLFYGNKNFSYFYPYSTELGKDGFLNKILQTRFGEYKLSEILNKLWISLIIEPGRSLLDQSGISIFKIQWVNINELWESIINVSGNFNHLSEQWFNTDYLPTPYLLKKSQLANIKDKWKKVKYSIWWNTCMESDILTYRKINFEHNPEIGDLIIYFNTAGYQMDSNESTFHHIPIPEKLIVYDLKDNNFKIKLDTLFTEMDLSYNY